MNNAQKKDRAKLLSTVPVEAAGLPPWPKNLTMEQKVQLWDERIRKAVNGYLEEEKKNLAERVRDAVVAHLRELGIDRAIDDATDASLAARKTSLERIFALAEAADEDAHRARDIYMPQLLRLNVATEIGYLARQVENREVGRAWALALLQCFEAPDSWWKEREHWPLSTWLLELTNLIRQHGDNVRLAWTSYEKTTYASHDVTSV